MNIICNSCVGSRIYELLGLEYKNPFMWNVIPYPDFKNLILKYSEIDFSNFEVSLYPNPKFPVAQALFDSAIRAYYIHYHYKKEYTEPKKVKIDIFANDILGYTKDKIEKRTKRMLAANEEPIFILETRNRPKFETFYTDDDIDNFISLDVPYKKILVTSHEKYKNYPSTIGNTKIFYFNDRHPELPPDTELMAKQIYGAFSSVFSSKEPKKTIKLV